jgi:hypothetical protein
MPYRRNYPATVAEVLDPNAKYKPDALRALRAFAREKPWRGTPEQRRQKFERLLAALSAVYGVSPRLTFMPNRPAMYVPAANWINLPQLSVVTFLHEFAHARGADERQACRWSINLFRRVFPRRFARCRQVGHMLITTPRERS